jgi:hypothetical protein
VWSAVGPGSAWCQLVGRRHRIANLIFVVAGVGFGSALYLARTRFGQYWRGSGLGTWIAVVIVAGLVFAAAARLHSQATRYDEERRELEDQRRAEEQERFAEERARRAGEREREPLD